MDKKELEKLDDNQKSRIAVAYLIKHEEEWPEGTSRFFNKLKGYEKSSETIFGAMEEAKRSLVQLQSNMEQLNGSIYSIVELISEDLPKDKIQGWAEKFEPPKMNSDMVTKNTPVESQDVDMAGATAKQSEIVQMDEKGIKTL